MEKWPIGAFASVDAGLGLDWNVVRELDIPTLQLHAPKPLNRTTAMAAQCKTRLSESGLELTAVFGGFTGESYRSIPIVEQTVGLVPQPTRAARLREMKQISDFARWLDCDVVALHLGVVPHDRSSQSYRDIVATTIDLCDHVRDNGQNLHLETGQESAAALVRFMNDTGANNLFVNFDPANMILYGTGQPVAALRELGRLVRSVHCKDACWSDKPGEEWGRETPLGEGDVDIGAFLNTLAEIGYAGPLTIEREIPQEPVRQKQEIGHAAKLLRQLMSAM